MNANSIRLVGNASALMSKQRRGTILSKINSSGALSSLASEDFSEAGKFLFGERFDTRIKTRSETSKTLLQAAQRVPTSHRLLANYHPTISQTFRSSHLHNSGSISTRTAGRSDRCFRPGLGDSERVCVCPLHTNWKMPAETSRSSGFSPSVDSPSLEIPTVVPLLLDLCIASPVFLPQRPGLLTRQGEIHPLSHLQLAGWLPSADSTLGQAFLKIRKTCSLPPGGWVPPLLTPQLGENGIAGAVNGSLIQFSHQLRVY